MRSKLSDVPMERGAVHGSCSGDFEKEAGLAMLRVNGRELALNQPFSAGRPDPLMAMR